MEYTDIIIAPVVTEKAQKLEELNKYSFIVNKKANKLQIKEAIEKLYNVTVIDVNTMNYSGKVKVRYTRSGIITGKKNSYKKAIVTLASSDKIDFYNQ